MDGIFPTHAHIGHYTGSVELANEGIGLHDTAVCHTEAMAELLTANGPWAFMIRQGRITPRPLATDRWYPTGDRLEVQLWFVPAREGTRFRLQGR